MLGDGLVQPGTFLKFRYNLPPEVIRSSGEVHDPNKEVFVLHPNWNNQLHGIDLKRLTPAQTDVLRLIMDPKTKDDPAALNKYPLVRDILNRHEPWELAKNPIAMYSLMIKPFLNRADAYRRYWRSRMGNIQVMESSKVEGKVMNPAPLFKKI